MRSTLLLAVREGIESGGSVSLSRCFVSGRGVGEWLTRSVCLDWDGGGQESEIWVPEDCSGPVRGRVACGSAKSSVRTKRAPTRDAQHDAPTLRIPLAEGR
jgi:hypothetical protein